MTEKLWKLTVVTAVGNEKVIALYDDANEALLDALELAEDDRVLGFRIKPEVHERGVRWDG